MMTDLLNDKKELEHKIRDILREMENKYGVIVNDINVYHIEYNNVDTSYNKKILQDVELDIKI